MKLFNRIFLLVFFIFFSGRILSDNYTSSLDEFKKAGNLYEMLEKEDLYMTFFSDPDGIRKQRIKLDHILNYLDQNPGSESFDKISFYGIGEIELKPMDFRSIVYSCQKILNDAEVLYPLIKKWKYYKQWSNLRSLYRKTIYSEDLEYNMGLIDTWNARMKSVNLSAQGQSRKAVIIIEDRISVLAVQSYYGIYGDEDRVNLNFFYGIYIDELNRIYQNYGIKSKALVILSKDDTVLTEAKSRDIWWKMKFMSESFGINYQAINDYIRDLEKSFCTERYTEYFEKYPGEIVNEFYSAREEIDFVRKNTGVFSLLTESFPFTEIEKAKKELDDKIVILAKAEDVGVEFAAKLQNQYKRFCANYK